MNARRTDPDTSHLAAAQQTPSKKATNQTRALEALKLAGTAGLNDFELARQTGIKQTSIGVRRGELVKAGLVNNSGHKRPSDTGSPSIVWVVA